MARFRYFEVDVLENKNDSNIYVGLIEEKEKFEFTLDSIDELDGEQTLILAGKEGWYEHKKL